MPRYSPIPTQVDLPALETAVLERWRRERTFERSVEQRAGAPLYAFDDGPPFATGLPHYGHILTGYMKDVVPRYFTMRGRYVPRRWGWDCHGLPVEYEVEKELGLSGRGDILAMGLAPMAVRPPKQRQGVGAALVREGLVQCRALGCDAVVVLGHPRYYPRFGFLTASRWGLRCEYDVPDEVFMALELRARSLAGKAGVIRYHPAFATS